MGSNKNNNSIDSFWDISSLVPSKKIVTKPRKDITTTEITVSDNEKTVNAECRLNTENRPTPKPERSKKTIYENISPLIKKAEIFDWKSDYNYYNFFYKQAKLYSCVEGKRCPKEPFFSYMPQYSQMTKKQLEWYFWWRQNARNGVYLETDHTYVLLGAMETINLATSENAKSSLDFLIALWSNYRDTYPQLNRSVGEWVCDLSLIFNIPIAFPDSRINSEMIASVSLPEIFYSFDINDSHLLSKFLLSFCNSYNYKKSKFYDENSAKFYDTHILGAFETLLKENIINKDLFTDIEKCSTRIAFIGGICTDNVKKRIEVTYVPYCLDSETKAGISNIIKYCENSIRTALGIRSRLGVKEIGDNVKYAIDKYFSKAFGSSAPGVLIEQEYERLYDVKTEEFSLQAAKEIELRSWDVTKKLVEAFDEEIIDVVEVKAPTPQVTPEPIVQSKQADSPRDEFMDKIAKYRELFELIKAESYSEQLAYVKNHKLIFEAVVDELNEIATDTFEDILFEEDGAGYKIIDDYKSIFEE